MSLGAAGCGYEYNNKCGFLEIKEGVSGTEFSCIKYFMVLKKCRNTGHPFRLEKCADEARKDAESLLAKQRLLRDKNVRGK